MSLHLEVLDPPQREALAALGAVLGPRGFYLGGGTGIALHLGHRVSFDLDWFTAGELQDPMALAGAIRAAGVGFETARVAPGTLDGQVGGVPVTLLEYRYPLLLPCADAPEAGCRIASLDDLACMKLAAVAQRGSRKDFVDVYALGLRHRPLREMIELYRRKYSTDDIGHLLYALSYFDDAERDPMPRMRWPDPWDAIRKAILGWTRDLARGAPGAPPGA